MMRGIYSVVAVALALQGASSSTAFAAGKAATQAEFTASVAGKTMSTKTKSGKSFIVTYQKNGSGTFSLDKKEPAAFSWSFKGDTICSVFDSLKFTECNRVEIISPTKVNFIDAKSGKLNNTYSVK